MYIWKLAAYMQSWGQMMEFSDEWEDCYKSTLWFNFRASSLLASQLFLHHDVGSQPKKKKKKMHAEDKCTQQLGTKQQAEFSDGPRTPTAVYTPCIIPRTVTLTDVSPVIGLCQVAQLAFRINFPSLGLSQSAESLEGTEERVKEREGFHVREILHRWPGRWWGPPGKEHGCRLGAGHGPLLTACKGMPLHPVTIRK